MTTTLANLRPLDVAGTPAPNGNGNGHRKKAERPFTMFDDVLLDEIMPTLSPAAWKVLSYILRRTIGYQDQPWAEISYSQFRAGRRSDGGAGKGVSSDTTIKKALKELEDRGLIEVRRLEREDGDARMPTAFYRAVLPPPAPETVADAPATAPENGAAQLHNLEQSTPENGAVNSRKWGCSTPFSGESKRNGKKRTKETLKETPQEDSIARAAAHAAASPEMGLHPSSGDTSSLREVGGPQAQQLAFAHRTPHGERLVPPDEMPGADQPPAGRDKQPARRADTTKGKTTKAQQDTGRVSLALEDDDPDDLWGAKLFLGQVPPNQSAGGFGWGSTRAPILEHWRGLCEPLVADLGRPQFARFVRYMEGEPWLAEDQGRVARVTARWLASELGTWEALPEQQQDIPKVQQDAAREQRRAARERARRRGDTGRVENNDSQREECFVCVGCNGELGTGHQEFCKLVKWRLVALGSPITKQHCDEGWAIPILTEIKARRKGPAAG